jgi:NifU-like protein
MGEEKKAAPTKPAKLTNLKRMQLIQETLENEVRPQLWADGGDLELIDIDGPNVQVAFRKACAGCASSGYTAKFVEQKLRELVSDDINVQEVQG